MMKQHKQGTVIRLRVRPTVSNAKQKVQPSRQSSW